LLDVPLRQEKAVDMAVAEALSTMERTTRLAQRADAMVTSAFNQVHKALSITEREGTEEL
jgi:hypothetical protein